ncbi:hypothetical protein K438DRAFT_1960735 [Mycena galopus ATCC 62051]|nr:hypothetical protein K438DRAFT_1960735 [Mycena galopus ATCC 62051]
MPIPPTADLGGHLRVKFASACLSSPLLTPSFTFVRLLSPFPCWITTYYYLATFPRRKHKGLGSNSRFQSPLSWSRKYRTPPARRLAMYRALLSSRGLFLAPSSALTTLLRHWRQSWEQDSLFEKDTLARYSSLAIPYSASAFSARASAPIFAIDHLADCSR